MKKYLLPILMLTLCYSCKKEGQDTLNPISDFIKVNYTEDAHRLLLRRIQNGDNVLNKNKASFSEIEVNRILSDIQAVYNLSGSERNQIFETDKIHSFPNPQLWYLTLQLNKDSEECKRIMKYEPSGNAAFESLMKAHGFAYSQHINTLSQFVSIKTNSAYNLVQLAKDFNAFSFVTGAELDSSVGDGNNIVYTKDGTVTTINFSVGTGDCPAGCGYRKGWIFTIINGKATLIKSY